MDILKATQFSKFSIDMQLLFQICTDLLVLIIEYFCEIVFAIKGDLMNITTKMNIQVTRQRCC